MYFTFKLILKPSLIRHEILIRFDTIFYTASLSEVPHTILEEQEISAVCWTDPGSILNQFYRRNLWLAPPQVKICFNK